MAQLIFIGTSIIQSAPKQISVQISSRLRENFRGLWAWSGKRLGVRHSADEEIPARQRAGNFAAVWQCCRRLRQVWGGVQTRPSVGAGRHKAYPLPRDGQGKPGARGSDGSVRYQY